MNSKTKPMFYLSALIAIVGVVAYHYLVKLVPGTLNPLVSVIGLYLAVLVLTLFLLPLYPSDGGLLNQFRQLNWIQLGLAVSVLMIELGYLLMYRYGWNLSTGNVITGVIINLVLAVIGLVWLGERLSLVNGLGILLCVVGVVLISYRP
jgi:drug/metabolite transporter (DMT)-like permease